MKELTKIIYLILSLALCLSACSKKEEQMISEKTPTTTDNGISHKDSVVKKQTSIPAISIPSDITVKIKQDKETEKEVSKYEDYLNSLNTNDINSISLAVNKINSIKSDDKFMNDSLYRSFYILYYTIIDNLNNSKEDLLKLDITKLNVNGLVVIDGEAGPSIHEKADFVVKTFCNSVSDGVKEYINLKNKVIKLMREGYIFEDALLTMSWNDLSDVIILHEKYIENYPTYKIEIENAKKSLDFFVYIYTQYLDTQTFAYMSDETDNEHELRDSYIRFLEKYPDSKYNHIFKGYLEILDRNGFRLDEEAKAYLIKNGIKVN